MKAAYVPQCMTDMDLDLKLDVLIYAWARRFPEEVKKYMENAKVLRQSTFHESGMSLGGTMLLKAAFPPRLFYKMCEKSWILGFPNNWPDDPRIMSKFMLKMRAFCVNQKSIPSFRCSERANVDMEMENLDFEVEPKLEKFAK